jgi:hypothetical protein
MTRSVREVLATLPDGTVTSPLDDAELASYLRVNYDTEAEKDRNARHAKRDMFYRDGGVQIMKDVIDDVFQTLEVRELRKKWVEHARFGNDVKRIVNEISTVYTEPAARKVGGTPENEKRYQALLESLMFDEALDHVNRLANLHYAVLVGPRVREDLDGNREMVLDVATPAVARAVTHPIDTTLVVAWLIRCSHRVARAHEAKQIAWQLWSNHEVIDLNESFVPVGADRVHELGVNRWVPLSLSPMAMPGFWSGDEGEDLIAAQVAMWMARILMLKEVKSATKMTLVSGDVSAAERGTASDTEVPRVLSEGVTATTVDMSMDVELFTKADDHILQRVANSRGLSVSALRHDMQSADARRAMLEPLRLLRKKQIKFHRGFEARLVKVMSAVSKKDGLANAFDVEQWHEDFGEVQELTTRKELMEDFTTAQSLGLDNIVAFFMRLNPDITDPVMARDLITQNVEIRTWMVELMQEFMKLSGADATLAKKDETPSPNQPPPPSGPQSVDDEEEDVPQKEAA